MQATCPNCGSVGVKLGRYQLPSRNIFPDFAPLIANKRQPQICESCDDKTDERVFAACIGLSHGFDAVGNGKELRRRALMARTSPSHPAYTTVNAQKSEHVARIGMNSIGTEPATSFNMPPHVTWNLFGKITKSLFREVHGFDLVPRGNIVVMERACVQHLNTKDGVFHELETNDYIVDSNDVVLSFRNGDELRIALSIHALFNNSESMFGTRNSRSELAGNWKWWTLPFGDTKYDTIWKFRLYDVAEFYVMTAPMDKLRGNEVDPLIEDYWVTNVAKERPEFVF